MPGTPHHNLAKGKTISAQQKALGVSTAGNPVVDLKDSHHKKLMSLMLNKDLYPSTRSVIAFMEEVGYYQGMSPTLPAEVVELDAMFGSFPTYRMRFKTMDDMGPAWSRVVLSWERLEAAVNKIHATDSDYSALGALMERLKIRQPTLFKGAASAAG